MQESTGTTPCPQCAHENTADTKYCGNCGLHIDGLCPTCGIQNAHSTHFCGNCGFDFATPAAPEPTDAPWSPPGPTHDLRSQQAPTGTGAPVQSSTPPQFRPSSIDCPRCHHTNEPGAAFCFNCGLPFDGATGFRQGNLVGSIPAYVGARPGGFWMRLFGLVGDLIIIGFIYSLLAPALIDETALETFQRIRYDGVQSPQSFFLDSALAVIYGSTLITFWATTIGKKLFSLRVLRPDRSKVSSPRAVGREMVKTITIAFFPAAVISAAMVAFREDKRALHDLIAGTVVVQR